MVIGSRPKSYLLQPECRTWDVTLRLPFLCTPFYLEKNLRPLVIFKQSSKSISVFWRCSPTCWVTDKIELHAISSHKSLTRTTCMKRGEYTGNLRLDQVDMNMQLLYLPCFSLYIHDILYQPQHFTTCTAIAN